MTNALRCLVVGIPGATFPSGGNRLEEAASISFDAFAEFKALPVTLEMVVAPLFCTDFDALELIEALGSRGYRGVLRVVAPKLPNRQIVLRELRSHAARQGLTVDMVEDSPPEDTGA